MTAHPRRRSPPEAIHDEEPLELVDPPEDEAVRMAGDWGTRRALTVANTRLAYWRAVIARLSGETVPDFESLTDDQSVSMPTPGPMSTAGQHDDLRFDIELALRGVGYRHRRRLKPRIRSEEEAHTLAGRVVDTLRAKYRIVHKTSSKAPCPEAP